MVLGRVRTVGEPLTTHADDEYGAPVLAAVCTACGRPFTVCPAPPPEKADQWRECLADDCPSYDLSRDVDLFFEPLAEAGLIEREASDG